MKREEFLKTCGFACLGGSLLGVLLEGCATTGKTVSGTIEESDLVIPVTAFQNKESFRKYVVVQHEKLKYPVCVYRFSETEYTALLLRCPHQGAELQVFGSRLQCPAHGSEFNNRGVVENGPADTNLRAFPVTEHNHQLCISLK
jgi:nitrite reductase/ring-hydroxylating ferredoxin subunit